MASHRYQFAYEVVDRIDQLNSDDKTLVEAAQKATTLAYAPYSEFKVGAAARLSNGVIIVGANQENASFPAGLCAERVLLAVAAANHPGEKIISLAISSAIEADLDTPLAPCGICRQSLQEYSDQKNQSIRLLLSGKKGKVYILEKASDLLPFAFTNKELS